MRFPLLLVLVVLAGCAPARTATTTFPVRRHDVASPVFDQPRALVLVAAARASRRYFNGQEIIEEPEAGLVHVVDREAWAGDVVVDIAIVELAERETRVDVVVEGFGRSGPRDEANTRRRAVNYLSRLDREVQELLDLERALPGQTATAGAVADPTTASSATSRP